MLLRHAKAARPGSMADRDRPLAERGREAAPQMGAYMRRENLLPDLTLVSTALRTEETWSLLGAALGPGVAKRDVSELYGASPNNLFKIIRTVPAEVRALMLVGHNPGIPALAVQLLGRGDAEARQRLLEKFPTCGLVVIDFEGDSWEEIVAGTGHLERFVSPDTIS